MLSDCCIFSLSDINYIDVTGIALVTTMIFVLILE